MIGVTGATGFVGRALLERLHAEGVPLVTLGRGSDADRHWDAGAGQPAPLEGLSAVVHLAAYLPSDYADPAEARQCIEVNAMGTLAVLRAAEQHGVDHVVTTSSGNIYTPQEGSATEASSAYPDRHAAFYLGSKLLSDLWTSHFAHRGLRTTVLRPSSIYGAGMAGGVVRIFADRLRRGERITLNNGGQHVADLVYVGDVAAACHEAVRQQATGRYNVGSGVGTTIGELAYTLCDLLELDPASHVVLEPQTGPPTGFSPLDTTRLGQLLPQSTALRDGLAAMLEGEA